MRQKRIFYTELAYVLGMAVLAVGTALMEKADMGMSMVVAPAYLLHRKISLLLPWFSFGMAEYVFQALLLVLLCLVMGRGKKSYLFSFATAVFYGLILDLALAGAALFPAGSLPGRLGCYLGGMVLCSFGVALLFRTYISPEAYELFVKELSAKHSWPISRVKTVYDCSSCLVGLVLSFAFFGFGRFVGVKGGTVFCALVNGWLIGRCSTLLDMAFTFRDGLPLAKYFEI